MSPIKIDGILDEKEWEEADIAKDFLEFQPDTAVPEKTHSPTFVKVIYNDTSLYIGAILEESKIDTLNTQLSERDDVGQADWFMVGINPLNDGQQFYQFLVSAAGVQADAYASSSNGEDWNWDALWDSKVKINKENWVVEMEIPYSALRFPNESDASWQINFFRKFSKNRKKFSWAAVNINQGNFYQYTGSITGIENIKPPTRLFFIPYSSFYYTKQGNENSHSIKGGMDIKWGLSDNFTLDAILIPDFGQTGFDNVEYVLGPFEQQFDERRAFFTEGTELFSKGNLLYTRRIGGSPSGSVTLNENEYVEENPTSVNLLNALKISGRTKKGWGIGVLNAITDITEINIIDPISNSQRKETIEPLANYNVAVVDKRFNQNSSISFINTNVTRNGSFRDANVSAIIFDLYDKETKYNTFGGIKFSTINDAQNKDGAFIYGGWEKTFGKNRYGGNLTYVSKNYDINDLGINFNTNYYQANIWHSYRILKSNEKYNSFSLNSNFTSRFNKLNNKPEILSYNINVNSQTLKNNFIGYGLSLRPFKTYDFYEPRQSGRFSENSRNFYVWFYSSPDYNKKFVIDLNPGFFYSSFEKNWSYDVSTTLRYRPSDKLLLVLDLNFDKEFYDRGYVTSLDTEIFYGARNRNTLTTSLSGNYYFNPLTSLHLNFRHYWTNAAYQKFYSLNVDGSYKDADFIEGQDFTFNNWNMDFRFSWRFAPGSQMDILYRNTLSNFNQVVENNLGRNLEDLFREEFTHVFSIRLSYTLDYNKAKTWL